MDKLSLYWEFHKSGLLINWALSIAVSIIYLPSFFNVLSISIMTAGPALSLLYKEINGKHEYYYYYNRGISKYMLIAVSTAWHIFTGIVILTISNATPA